MSLALAVLIKLGIQRNSLIHDQIKHKKFFSVNQIRKNALQLQLLQFKIQ